MICPKCGANNIDGSSFCIKCGNNLKEIQQTINNEQSNLLNSVSNNQNDNIQINNNINNNINANINNNINANMNNNSNSIKMSFKDYFSSILMIIKNPTKAIKDEKNNFNVLKNTAIMALIISIGITLLKLITTMINTIFVKSYDYLASTTRTTIKFGRLKYLNYLELIWKNFLIYLGIIVAIAVVYYLASLIIKKKVNFSRLLGISTVAVAPMFISLALLSPLLSLVWSYLGISATIIGLIYTIIILYESMNNELLLEGNTKYYLNLGCLSILGVGMYYIYMKILISSISSGLGNLF